MQRTQFGAMACSIARTMDVAGEPWSPLIVRNVYVGISRFDQLQESLGISRKVLAERLRWLTGTGVLARREYSASPVRYEYLLTEKGLDLVEVLMVMVRWGDKWLADEAGPPVLYRHHACGQISHVELHCSECGEPMGPAGIDVLPGPGSAAPEELPRLPVLRQAGSLAPHPGTQRGRPGRSHGPFPIRLQGRATSARSAAS